MIDDILIYFKIFKFIQLKPKKNKEKEKRIGIEIIKSEFFEIQKKTIRMLVCVTCNPTTSFLWMNELA